MYHLLRSCREEKCGVSQLCSQASPQQVASCPMAPGLPLDLQLQFMVLVWTLPVAGMPVMNQSSPETPGAQRGRSTNSWSGSSVNPRLSPQECCSPSCCSCPAAKAGATSQPGETGAGYRALPLHMTAPCTPSRCEGAEPCLSLGKFHKELIFLI